MSNFCRAKAGPVACRVHGIPQAAVREAFLDGRLLDPQALVTEIRYIGWSAVNTPAKLSAASRNEFIDDIALYLKGHYYSVVTDKKVNLAGHNFPEFYQIAEEYLNKVQNNDEDVLERLERESQRVVQETVSHLHA